MRKWTGIAVFLLAVTCCTIPAWANDSLLIHRLVQRIAAQQVRVNGHFAPGMFPSYREYDKHRNVFKDDDNIFFTGLVIFTLQQLRPYLPEADSRTCDSIIGKAAPLYARFRSRQGRHTYGFWRTDTPEVFPNGGWLNWMNKSHELPNDMDDTAIILLASDAPDSIVRRVHELMQHYTNNGRKKVRNTFAAYKKIPTYSTWFGNRMPVDFDVCVLSNILYLVQKYRLPFTRADSAAVQLIQQVIADKRYMTHAGYVSPHYSRSAIILYHLSRLMQLQRIPALEAYRQQLVNDAKELYAQSDNFIDKVILATSLLRWGQPAPQTQLQLDTDLQTFIENNDFVFFIANMASMLPNPLKQWVGKAGIGRFFYYCPAYNNVLLLEYLVWKQRQEAPSVRRES